ncbi:MAG TPA: hypothetical protein VFF98_03450 [Novosphingobium sp.]|nr:hypothetical protein [Novosphingobium sp.]
MHAGATRIASWPAPAGGAEMAVLCGPEQAAPLLLLPALFDEGNKLRRFTLDLMRALAGHGIASVLPDLPGSNESLAPLEAQDLGLWRQAMAAAAAHFGAIRGLALRGGALVAPAGLAGRAYAPVAGASLLRQMLRARIIAAHEAGLEESTDALLATGQSQGLELAGHRLGPRMLADLAAAQPAPALTPIAPGDIPGPGLWLRAEPGENRAQAEALAAVVAGA